MITKAEVLNELRNLGYDVKSITKTNNGVDIEGIVIKTSSNISPILYVDDILDEANAQGLSLQQTANFILRKNEEHWRPSVDLENFLTSDSVYEHAYIAFQQCSNEELIKRDSPFSGIEEYVYIKNYEPQLGDYTAKLTPAVADFYDIDKLWKSAYNNTINSARIAHISDLIRKVMSDELFEEYDKETDITHSSMYVISNKFGENGAAAIYNKRLLKEVAQKFGTSKLIVLPASIHEQILMPYKEGMDPHVLAEIVRDINATEVAPKDKLSDEVFIITV